MELPLYLVPAIAFALTLLFFPLSRLPKTSRLMAAIAVSAALFTTPFFVAYAPIDRFCAALLSAAFWPKICDTYVGTLHGVRMTFPQYLLFVAHPFSLVWRKLHLEPRPPLRENLVRLLYGASLFVLGYGAYHLLKSRDMPHQLMEYFAGVIPYLIAAYGITVIAVAGFRFTGIRAREMHYNFFLARTPADFWRRWNRPAGQILYEDILKRFRGSRSIALATLFTFAINGLLHEWIALVTNGVFNGFQMIFFMLQGLAVLATRGFKPTGWAVVPWILGTLIFNAFTTMLAFTAFPRVSPIEVNALNPLPPSILDLF
ncbi:MAG: hypothetical protein L6Q71_06545 [Planctomycetes bacterium]|nr:hypothetical protein [Planctomycetota bacterium]NUQ34535.1 hypothetical protein [Planctomycetaceae bacterium]